MPSQVGLLETAYAQPYFDGWKDYRESISNYTFHLDGMLKLNPVENKSSAESAEHKIKRVISVGLGYL